MPLYDKIGKTYQKTRPTDPRISERLIALLNLPENATILDVGAGTGKYSRALADHGFNMLALEPSEIMRSQSVPHNKVRFIQASAEKIPLADGCVDGAIIVLALHHFQDRLSAYREVLRVTCDGALVIFTFDPGIVFESFWLAHYFPKLGSKFAASKLALSNVAAELQSLTIRKVETIPFPLPRDLKDKFGAACWACPEAYLDEEIRDGISDFPLMPKEDLEKGLELLKADLASGRWDEKYGYLRTQDFYDAGYRFIVTGKV